MTCTEGTRTGGTCTGAACDDTAALLAEQNRLLAEQGRLLVALRDEVEALRTAGERGQLEVLRRVEQLRVASVQPHLFTARPPVDEEQARTVVQSDDSVVPASGSVRDGPGHPAIEKQPPMSSADYSRLVTRVRSLARTVVPVNAVVAVLSRGDEALVELEGRIAWHFPRLEDGRWAGYHPADGNEAVAHLDLARRKGARYLLIPATALWWLDHYEGFRDYLEAVAAPVLQRDDACRIFALNPPGAA